MESIMTKDVILSIKGLQNPIDGEEDECVVITAGNYYNKNGKHYILYQESTEGMRESTKNTVKFQDNMLEVTKKGEYNVHMVFEENKKNYTYYGTPFGNLLVGIATRKINIDELQGKIEVSVDYELEVNYEHVADCVIHMDIQSKGMEPFRLQ